MDEPHVHAPHASHTGHRVFDLFVAGTAVLISLISLGVAVHHGQTMERLVAANSWPNAYVDWEVVEGATPDSARLALIVANNGVGPARVETLELWHDGTPVGASGDFLTMLRALAPDERLQASLGASSVIGTVLGAGDSRRVVTLEAGRDRWALPLVRLADAMESRLCYCSVFDECFLADTRTGRGRPESVDACPTPDAAFDDRAAGQLLEMLDQDAVAPD